MGRTFVTGTTLSNALISRRLRLLDVGDACLQHVEATLKHAVLSDGRHLRNGPDTLRSSNISEECPPVSSSMAGWDFHYGHLEGKLIYHRVDFPLPCLITKSQMVQEKTWCCC